jgi:hypothetical protein
VSAREWLAGWLHRLADVIGNTPRATEVVYELGYAAGLHAGQRAS